MAGFFLFFLSLLVLVHLVFQWHSRSSSPYLKETKKPGNLGLIWIFHVDRGQRETNNERTRRKNSPKSNLNILSLFLKMEVSLKIFSFF